MLVVDDDADLAETYALWLDEEYDVHTATSGQQALDAHDDAVDVVLLDRRMPGRSGDDLLGRLRDRSCVVSMVTAVEPGPDVVDLPFDDYLVKPVTRSTLVDTVDQLHSLVGCGDGVREVAALGATVSALEATDVVDPETERVTERLREEYARRRETLEGTGGVLGATAPSSFSDATD